MAYLNATIKQSGVQWNDGIQHSSPCTSYGVDIATSHSSSFPLGNQVDLNLHFVTHVQ